MKQFSGSCGYESNFNEKVLIETHKPWAFVRFLGLKLKICDYQHGLPSEILTGNNRQDPDQFQDKCTPLFKCINLN